MNKYFDFSEALNCLNYGMHVGIEINNTTREYFTKDGLLYCKSGITTHVVNKLFWDAINSNKWFLVD